jgi:hypothetical protein
MITISFSSFAQAKEWPRHSSEEVTQFLKKTQACWFAWFQVGLPAQTVEQKTFEVYTGDMVGKVVQSSDAFKVNFRDTRYINNRTEVYCIFDGISGSGINKKSGCFAGRYDVDNDVYQDFVTMNTAERQGSYGFMDQKCSPQVAKELLLSTVIHHPLGKTQWKGAWAASQAIAPIGEGAREYRILVDTWGIGNSVLESYKEALTNQGNSEVLEMQKAKSGDATSQLKVGKKYLGKLDKENGLYWIEKAAQKGLADAQFEYAILLDSGRSTATETAKEWLEKAAVQNQGLAQNELGKYYDFRGPQATIDPKKAAEWYLRAANQDIPEACANLGKLFLNGRGVKKDMNEALKWYQKAADLGDMSSAGMIHLLKLQILNSQQ